MTSLDRVAIKRFKGITAADFDLGDLNVFVGGNNSGKTTVIQAVHFAFTLFQSLEISGKWPSKNQKSTTISPDELIYVPSLDPYSLGNGGKLREAEDQSIELDFYFSDGEIAKLRVRKGRITNVLVEPSNIDYLRKLSGLNEPYSIFSPGLADVSKSEQYVSDGVLLRALARGDANSFLRNILLRLHQNKDAWGTFLEDLSRLFPSIQFDIAFEEGIDEKISVTIARDGVEVPLDLAGTGLLQAIQIFAYFNLYNPKIMVFDEPDSHLHPDNQRNLCSLFREISQERETQVLITTHSRHMIDSLLDDASFIWMQSGSAHPASKHDQVEILVDLGALDVRERLHNENVKFVFLTEDANSQGLKSVILANDFDEKEFVILSYKGVTSTHLLAPLIHQIGDVSQAVVVVHRDRDFLEPDEVAEWEQEIRSLNAEPFVTVWRDIERYLTTEEFLTAYLHASGLCSLQDLKEFVVEGQHDVTVEKFVNARVDIERKAGRGAKINQGKLAGTANKKVTDDPWGTMLTKTRARRIRDALQAKFGHRFQGATIADIPKDGTLESIRRRNPR